MTQPFAEVIGDPIAQSKSPAIHGFWLGKLGIDAGYRATLVESDGLSAFLANRRSTADWRGCNVTMPHKQAIMPMLDRIDDLALRVGAVNTVVRADDGLLTGFNTDVAGFLEPLEPVLSHTHLYRMARVIGTGGAARAVIAGLAGRGFTIVLAARNPGKARALLDELDPGGEHHVTDLAHFSEPTDFAFDDRKGICDLVVNASLLGMAGQPPLHFDWSHAPPGAIAYDIVTSPLETEFLKSARDHGFDVVDGLAMLIGQAAVAFEKFFGQPAPRQHDAELRALLVQ